MRSASVFAPGSIGNVGPGFDVLGLAIDGIGDEVMVELYESGERLEVSGRDAELIPREPQKNLAYLGATAWLRRNGSKLVPRVKLRRGLPLAGGLGGSAADTVGGIAATALALGENADPATMLEVALDVESTVSGRHLDNAAASVYGGLILVRSVDPIDVVSLPVDDRWWLTVVTPQVRVETKAARAILPQQSDRATWVQQMANTAALTHALISGDATLLKRALDDRFAEPVRSRLIPHFDEVKKAALDNGAAGCSISGAGPTLFAISDNENDANACADAMRDAFREIASTAHVGKIAKDGVRRL